MKWARRVPRKNEGRDRSRGMIDVSVSSRHASQDMYTLSPRARPEFGEAKLHVVGESVHEACVKNTGYDCSTGVMSELSTRIRFVEGRAR